MVATESGAREPVPNPLKHDPVEIIATVLLSLAAVATAWSGYQASRWHGEQAQATSRTTALEIDAARAESRAEAQTEVDVATFTEWVDAEAGGDVALADFYPPALSRRVQTGVRRMDRNGAVHKH